MTRVNRRILRNASDRSVEAGGRIQQGERNGRSNRYIEGGHQAADPAADHRAVFAVLVGMADTIMVAGVGETAVSGISLVDTLNILLINVFTAMATGGAVIAAQELGDENQDEALKASNQLIFVVLIFSSVLMVLVLTVQLPDSADDLRNDRTVRYELRQDVLLSDGTVFPVSGGI